MAKETLLILFIVGIVAITALATNFMTNKNIGGEATQTPSTNSISQNQQQILQQYNNRPIYFLKNEGQWEPNILYQGSRNGAAVQFLPDALSFAIGREIEHEEELEENRNELQEEDEYEYLVFNLQFLNAQTSTVTNSDETPSKTSYLKGKDSSKWVIHAPQTEKITYNTLYPNIDLTYYTQGKTLKYDFIIQPGGRVSDIRLQYQGIQNLEMDSEGKLLIHHPWGTLADQKPLAYQMIKGQTYDVPVQYILLDSTTYGFQINGNYDPQYELIIDPSLLIWSTYMGATSQTGNNYAYDIAIDANQDIYITGHADDSYPTTPGVYQGANAGFLDAFVTKLKNDGTDALYSTFLGGTDYEWGYSIAVNTAGEAYITGHTYSTDFSIVPGAYQSSNAGGSDVFVTKLNADGTDLIYSTYLGGGRSDSADAITIDTAGEAYITGATTSPDFPTTLGSYQFSNAGSSDVFVTKLKPTGAALTYSTYLGGSRGDGGDAITIDTAGEAYITGATASLDFPITPTAYQTANAGGGFDVFITKLNSLGIPTYSTYLGGEQQDRGFGIAVNMAGEAFIAGNTRSLGFPILGAYQSSNAGRGEVFVTKLNAAGTALFYSTFLGGTDQDTFADIAINIAGQAFITGYTFSTDFPTTPTAYQLTNAGYADIFITHLSKDGQTLACGGSTYFGGSRNDYAIPRSALDPTGTYLYITGTTHSDDFPIQDRFGITGPAADVYYSVKPNPGDSDQPMAIKMKTCDELQCGGKRGLPCLAGYHCVCPEPNHPDQFCDCLPN